MGVGQGEVGAGDTRFLFAFDNLFTQTNDVNVWDKNKKSLSHGA